MVEILVKHCSLYNKSLFRHRLQRLCFISREPVSRFRITFLIRQTANVKFKFTICRIKKWDPWYNCPKSFLLTRGNHWLQIRVHHLRKRYSSRKESSFPANMPLIKSVGAAQDRQWYLENLWLCTTRTPRLGNVLIERDEPNIKCSISV